MAAGRSRPPTTAGCRRTARAAQSRERADGQWVVGSGAIELSDFAVSIILPAKAGSHAKINVRVAADSQLAWLPPSGGRMREALQCPRALPDRGSRTANREP